MDLHTFFNRKNYWGKLLGAIFGFLMGGPAGALFGILVGNFFDRGLSEHFARPYGTFQHEKNRQTRTLFIQTTFMIMGYIAKADGRVSEPAIAAANAVMHDLHFSKMQVEVARQAFTSGKSPEFKLVDVLLTFKRSLQHQPNLIMTFLDIQYRVLQTQGLTTKKLRALNQVAQVLGFAPLHEQAHFYENSRRSSDSYQSGTSLSEAYSILKLDMNASEPAVKKAYRRLISQHHPDKLIAKSKSDAEIKRANERTQKIRKAYEKICEVKGWG